MLLAATSIALARLEKTGIFINLLAMKSKRRQRYLHYDHLIKAGIKFAPIDIAIRFSFEQSIPEYPFWHNAMSLGFHGLFQPGWDNDEFRLNLKKQYNLL